MCALAALDAREELKQKIDHFSELPRPKSRSCQQRSLTRKTLSLVHNINRPVGTGYD